ncbi:hypothetical protein AREALGSMS7_00544 [Arenibacter algicola]|uniref:Uncharacterized protein n=1 Tax=Arenibacter algicola TaxID=616991 RepID=A0A221US09_9FLAO|nr:hypothetical protein AREALGSMS7_00544 [Arenibacter algicola]
MADCFLYVKNKTLTSCQISNRHFLNSVYYSLNLMLIIKIAFSSLKRTIQLFRPTSVK